MPAKSDRLWAKRTGIYTLNGIDTEDQKRTQHTFFTDPYGENRQRWSNRLVWRTPGTVACMAGILDFCLILTAAVTPYTVSPTLMGGMAAGQEGRILAAVLAATLFVGVLEHCGGYQAKQLSNLKWQLITVPKVWGGVTLLILFLLELLNRISENHLPIWVPVWITVALGTLLTGRSIFHFALAHWWRAGHFARNVVIVGAGQEGQRLIAKLHALQDTSIVVRGVFDDHKSGIPDSIQGVPVLGTTDELLRYVHQYPVDEAIIALPLEEERQLGAVFDKLKGIAIDLRLSIEPIAEKFQIRGMSYVSDVPVFEIADRPLKSWKAVVKRTEDVLLASFLLVLFGPLMSLAAFLIKLDSQGPVFFTQSRFGFNNRPIRVLKFRTMYTDRGDLSGAQRTVQNDPRITRVGRILRCLSIDELPQLINVLCGDMSLVGPRAHAIAMKAGDRLYCDAVERYLHRHRVRPGITGWAQVNGLRGEIDTVRKAQARVEHDLYYIEHWSFLLDVKILLKTAFIIMLRDNAY